MRPEEPFSNKLIRVQYEMPPMRAIYETWYPDVDADEKDIRWMFEQEHPRGVIRKIEKISKDEARVLTGEDDPSEGE